MVNIEERLTKELDITLKQVQNVIKLLGLTASITTPDNSAADKLEITLTYEHGNIIRR